VEPSLLKMASKQETKAARPEASPFRARSSHG
jgi:hypothetical protein